MTLMPSELSPSRMDGGPPGAPRTAAPVAGAATHDLERAYRALHPKLVSFARSFGAHEEAEDVVHDALLKYWRRAERDPFGVAAHDLESLLVSLVFQVAYDRKRTNRRRLTLAQWITGPSAAVRRWMSPVRHTADDEIVTKVERLLAALPRRWREVWILAYDDQLSYDAIGELLGMSASTARAHCSRASARLRRALGQMGLDPRGLRGRGES